MQLSNMHIICALELLAILWHYNMIYRGCALLGIMTRVDNWAGPNRPTQIFLWPEQGLGHVKWARNGGFFGMPQLQMGCSLWATLSLGWAWVRPNTCMKISARKAINTPVDSPLKILVPIPVTKHLLR